MVFTIPKGKHYASLFQQILPVTNSLTVQCTLDKSCTYDLGDADQLDWNKLIGISGAFNHHWFSCRICWRWSLVKQRFELCFYHYANGIRIIVPIGFEPNIEESFFVSFVNIEGKLCANINNETLEIPFPKRTFYPVLRPHFGGNKAATKDTFVKIDIIERC